MVLLMRVSSKIYLARAACCCRTRKRKNYGNQSLDSMESFFESMKIIPSMITLSMPRLRPLTPSIVRVL